MKTSLKRKRSIQSPSITSIPMTVRKYLNLSNIPFVENENETNISIKTFNTSNINTNVTLDSLIFTNDVLFVDNKPIHLPTNRSIQIIAWNKPKNMVIDTSIGQPFRTILDAIKTKFNIASSLFPIGQLDKNTTGLYLFTTNGQISNYINLKGILEKKYIVTYIAPKGREPTLETIDLLCTNGIDVTRSSSSSSSDTSPKVIVKANSVRLISVEKFGVPYKDTAQKYKYQIELSISSGANHIVKRLIAGAALPPVRELKRSHIGHLNVDVCVNESVLLNKQQIELLIDPNQLVLLEHCNLLCRWRETKEPLLLNYLKEHFRVDGECFHEFPMLSCRSGRRHGDV